MDARYFDSNSINKLFQVVNHGFSTILSCKFVDGIIQKLDNAVKALIKNDVTCEETHHILKQYESTVSSFVNLISDWSKYSPSYPDVILPLLSNVSEFVYGLKSNLELLKKLLVGYEYKKFGVDVQQEVRSLVGIPSLDREHKSYESLIESYANVQVKKIIDYSLRSEENTFEKKQEQLR